MRYTGWVGLLGLLALSGTGCAAEEPRDNQGPTPYAKWSAGPGHDASYFPIAVWLQSPHNAKRYQAVGINLYIGLWEGPTAEQLAALKAAGMKVICEQNAVALADANRDIIVGWMHGDEPDNAQPLPDGKGYGPPVDPARIVADYQRIRTADPTRPVLLNLGQGVAWDGWYGRGVRTNHPEDYPKYAKGGDILSFDIYPVVHDHADIRGKLEWVPRGVDRLRSYSQDGQVVWNCIECTRIGNKDVKPTPAQVRSEVWLSLIHGSRGIIYFSHQFAPSFIEAGMLADDAMAKAIAAVNAQITELAPVLNSPTLSDAVKVSSDHAEVPVDTLVKRAGDTTYLFAGAARAGSTKATFKLAAAGAKEAVVLGEQRKLAVTNGSFSDDFADYGVHLYAIR